MQVESFIRQGSELRSVQVELSLVPGLPQITFLGLPDAALKESVLRIRTALRAQGFKLPRGKQILVQLRPGHLRKSSRGLDLAVAAAYLWETEQVPRPACERPVLYGELSLTGHVSVPDDASLVESTESIYTGRAAGELPFASYSLGSLTDLARPLVSVGGSVGSALLDRPPPEAARFAVDAAELAMIVAAGEHSALIAGPQGSGKSTLAASILSWVEAPSESLLKGTRREGLTWRPIARPHCSITPLAMIGGGTRPWAGEIHHAHGGLLLMDEFLNFHPEIQAALREPTETGSITISRGGVREKFDARWLLLGTTNLCRCGQYVPNSPEELCRCSGPDRRRHLARLSGPFADRFAVIGFSGGWRRSRDTVASVDIAARVSDAISFRRELRSQLMPNAYASAAGLEESLPTLQKRAFLDDLDHGSLRRREAVLRIARTIADLRMAAKISDEDLEAALRLSVRNHRLLGAGV